LSKQFITAIENNDLKSLMLVPKSDLHNHSTRGGNKIYIENWAKTTIPEPDKFNSLDDMQKWYDTYIKPFCQGQIGFIKRIEAAFKQAVDDGITLLSMSFGTGDRFNFNGSMKEYIEAIEEVRLRIAPSITFIPEICFMRTNDISYAEKEFDEVLSYNYFKSIDLVGDDSASVDNYKNIYKKAKENNMILKAHVGEFGNAQSIIKAVEVLNLDQVQHGINAVQSKDVMKELAERKIQLNICPSSNVLLSRTKDYNTHQIKELFHAGVKVTINSDDMLIFNQSVSDDYLNLFKEGLFSAEELDSIRKQGLSSFNIR